jgi:hypothetical protein
MFKKRWVQLKSGKLGCSKKGKTKPASSGSRLFDWFSAFATRYLQNNDYAKEFNRKFTWFGCQMPAPCAKAGLNLVIRISSL